MHQYENGEELHAQVVLLRTGGLFRGSRSVKSGYPSSGTRQQLEHELIRLVLFWDEQASSAADKHGFSERSRSQKEIGN